MAPKNADEDDQEPEKVATELWVMGQAVSYDPLRVASSCAQPVSVALRVQLSDDQCRAEYHVGVCRDREADLDVQPNTHQHRISIRNNRYNYFRNIAIAACVFALAASFTGLYSAGLVICGKAPIPTAPLRSFWLSTAVRGSKLRHPSSQCARKALMNRAWAECRRRRSP